MECRIFEQEPILHGHGYILVAAPRSRHISGHMGWDINSVFKVFSSTYDRDQKITWIHSHRTWDLTDPLKCYSFMYNIAAQTPSLLSSLQSISATNMLESLEANAWLAPSPPTSTMFEFDVAMWDEEDMKSAESAVLTRGREGWRIEDQSSRQEVPGAECLRKKTS